VIVTVLSILGLINYLGVRLSARVINFLTVAKISSLLLLITAGLILLDLGYLREIRIPPVNSLVQGLLVVMFVFTGFEVIGIPGAEVINPRKNLPLGMLIGTLITVTIYLLIQIVAVGADPQLSTSQRPLAGAAQKLMGTKGGIILSAGAVCSTIGTLMSLILNGSRILFAMAVNEQMPSVLAKVHARFRTPYVSIVFLTLLSIVLTLSGTFTSLATLSALARLMTYIGSALALMILRRKIYSPETFHIPGGPTVPLIAILFSVFLLTGASKLHWITGTAAIVIGLGLYFLGGLRRLRNS
jgi:amino acid transporter